MSILIDNKAVTDINDSKDRINVLSCKEITMVHDDIYFIKTHDNHTFLKESKEMWMQKPVVEFNILTANKLLRNVRFVLEENSKTRMNFAALGIKHQDSAIKHSKLMNESVCGTTYDINEQRLKRAADENIAASKQRIVEIIESQKPLIVDIVKKQTSAEIKETASVVLDELITVRDALIDDISKQRELLHTENILQLQELVDSADTAISKNVKSQIDHIQQNLINLQEAIVEGVDARINESTNTCKTDIREWLDLQKSQINNLFESQINRIRQDLSTIQEDIVEGIDSTLNENTNTCKSNIQEWLDLQKSQISDLIESKTVYETQLYVQAILEKLQTTKDNLIAELNNCNHTQLLQEELKLLKQDINADIADARVKIKEASSNNSFEKIKKLFEQELKNIHVKVSRIVESGGGTNAVQYADGGYMNGSLTVHGDISASGNMYASNILRKLSFAVGDSMQNIFEFTHNWNTDDIVATVTDNNTKAVVYPSVMIPTLSSIVLEFTNVPSNSAYKLTIIG